MAKSDLQASNRGDREGVAAVFGDPASLAAVWLLLVVIGVAGRLWQPAYNVTPMAAVGLAAGFVFGNPLLAISVPVAAMAVSNLFLPGYGSLGMAAVVFAATAWPALLGRLVPGVREGRTWTWLGGALAHSLVFFFATNLAYWWIFDDYPKSFAGLSECFAMALPFYRWMPVGDAAWSLAAVGLLRSVSAGAERRSLQTGGGVPNGVPVGGRGVPLD